MPKAGVSLPRSDIEKIRKIHKDVLDENKDLKAVVSEALRGLRGSQRQKAWGKAINKLLSSNVLYRDAVRAKIRGPIV